MKTFIFLNIFQIFLILPLNAQWVNLQSGTNVDLNGVFFVNEYNGWVCGNSGTILKTTDGGNSWSIIKKDTLFNLLCIDFLDSLTGFAAGSNSIIYKTTNGGNTWILKNVNPSVNLRDIKFLDSTTILAVGDFGKILLSTDQGTTWQIITNNTDNLWSISSLKKDKVWIGGDLCTKVSSDGGYTWVNSFAIERQTLVLMCNDNLMWRAGYTLPTGAPPRVQFYKSSNGGNNWMATTVIWSAIIEKMQYMGLGLGYALGRFNLYKTSNNGDNWTFIHDFGTSSSLRDFHFTDIFEGYIVGSNGKIIKTDSLPLAPAGLTAEPEWFQIKLNWLKNKDFDLQGYNIYRSKDTSGTYTKLNQSLLSDTSFTDYNAQAGVFYHYYVKAVDLDSYEGRSSDTVTSRVISMDQGILVIDETENGNGTLMNPTDEEVDSFYQSILQGFTFKMHDINTDGIPGLADIGAYSTVIWSGDDQINFTSAIDARTILKAYMELGGNFFYSGFRPSRAFYGSTYYPKQISPGHFIYDMLKIQYLNFKPSARFFGGNPAMPGYNYINTDSTKTLPADFYHLPNIESIGAAPSGYEFYSYDTKYDTLSWQGSMYGMPVGVEYLGTDYKAVTLSFPLYYMEQQQAKEFINFILTEKLITGIREPVSEVPEQFSLLQNYPNPFNPVTTIKYSLSSESKVNLTVYDILGQEIAVIVDELKIPGTYSNVFKASDITSGIYFYHLHVQPSDGSATFIQTGKMILLR